MASHSDPHRRPQTAALYVSEQEDGTVRVDALYEPRIDRADSAHVPNAVEILMAKLLRLAVEQGAKER